MSMRRFFMARNGVFLKNWLPATNFFIPYYYFLVWQLYRRGLREWCKCNPDWLKVKIHALYALASTIKDYASIMIDGLSRKLNKNSYDLQHINDRTFPRYFIISIESIIIPSSSFIEADLAKRHLLIGVLDGTLKAGCSNVI